MRTIGILGGMGPAAGADFYARIVAAHGALRDQDHPPCILYSATQVPDRSAFLIDAGADPTPELIASAGLLEAAGADFIAMPCNSAHAFLQPMRAAVSIPLLDMIALAAAAAARLVSGSTPVGVLGTDGTVGIGLYDAPLRARGLEPMYPADAVQRQVMSAIRDVKGGQLPEDGADERLVEAARHLSERGAACIIMACTEVPLAFDAAASPVAAIDGNQTLVDATLALAVGRMEFEEIADAVR